MSHSASANAALAHEEAHALESRDFGFWLYLMTDAIIFALLFATYAVLSGNTAAGPSGREVFDLAHTAGETALLLVSSITFGVASLFLKVDQTRPAVLWLGITLILGLLFLVMELTEFSGMIAEGAGPQTSGFLTAFFTLIGTHGLHVAVGSLGIVVLMGQILVKGATAPVRSRLHRLGMFWHFLDIVWIGIFSVVYLPAVL